MPYIMPVGVDVFYRFLSFRPGVLPVLAAGQRGLLLVDLDSHRTDLSIINVGAAGTDYVLISDQEIPTEANSFRLPGAMTFPWQPSFPARNRLWAVAATANTDLRIVEGIMQSYRQSVSPDGRAGQRIRANAS